MKRFISSLLIAVVAIIFSAPRASAQTTLDVNITFTIDHVIAVEWAGTGHSGTGAKTWTIGTIALDGTTGSPVDVDLIIVTNVAGWTAGSDSGANTYEIRAAVGAANIAALRAASNITTTNTANFINALAAAGTTSEIDFLFDAPSTISSGAGVAQTIVLRFTASLDD
jgi:hypothetical protein